MEHSQLMDCVVEGPVGWVRRWLSLLRKRRRRVAVEKRRQARIERRFWTEMLKGHEGQLMRITAIRPARESEEEPSSAS